jgi:hypothetical protein
MKRSGGTFFMLKSRKLGHFPAVTCQMLGAFRIAKAAAVSRVSWRLLATDSAWYH